MYKQIAHREGNHLGRRRAMGEDKREQEVTRIKIQFIHSLKCHIETIIMHNGHICASKVKLKSKSIKKNLGVRT